MARECSKSPTRERRTVHDENRLLTRRQAYVKLATLSALPSMVPGSAYAQPFRGGRRLRRIGCPTSSSFSPMIYNTIRGRRSPTSFLTRFLPEQLSLLRRPYLKTR